MSEPQLPKAVLWESTACPLCGDARSRPIFVSGDLLYGCPGEFTLARCDGCGHVFLNPRPTRACIGQFYPSDYGPFRGTASEFQSPTGVESRARRSTFDPRSWRWLRRLVLWWIESHAAPIPKLEISNLKSQISKRALELGCAHGAFLDQLRQRGWECVGVEPAGDVAGRARAKGLDVRVGSLEEVVTADQATFASASFDAVFAWMVIEHLHDPVATLRLARKLLKPGGWLLFSVPNFGCWERRVFGRFWYALQLPTHLQQFAPATVRRLLESSGYELVELIHQRNVNNLVGSAGLWLRAKFPRCSLGERLIRWTDNPSALGLCCLAPLAKSLAAIRQCGRLTVVARRSVIGEPAASVPEGTESWNESGADGLRSP